MGTLIHHRIRSVTHHHRWRTITHSHPTLLPLLTREESRIEPLPESTWSSQLETRKKRTYQTAYSFLHRPVAAAFPLKEEGNPREIPRALDIHHSQIDKLVLDHYTRTDHLDHHRRHHGSNPLFHDRKTPDHYKRNTHLWQAVKSVDEVSPWASFGTDWVLAQRNSQRVSSKVILFVTSPRYSNLTFQ